MSVMGDDPDSKDAPSDGLKRPLSPTEDKKSPPNKKVRLSFSVKDLRKQLKSEQKTQALQGFLRIIEEEKNHECILTYLEHGGSALEILQTMEGDSGAPPELVLDVVNHILLQIGTKLGKYQNAAYDASRYLLNTYLPQINKMLNLSSSMKERLVTLKLLTTIVTFSAVLAKDVLLQVNFNPTNVELLTKVGEGKNEARNAFIHFIIAFLVDGHFPTFSVLLEKKGLMTSIISGLKFDKADVVVLVLTAMKNHILENGSVSKTVKMKTFNTQVVRDIVNLYNWKGPAGLTNQKKMQKTATVDEVDKSKVNEAVHSFLLVLCASHKYGVIFKDPMVGLGQRQNSLMYTILQSLERPWEHSYAGELVIKICRACPDLAKTVWTNLKSFLEPRWTEKWLKAMKFAERLLQEFQPDCIDFAVNSLNVRQVSQVITILTSPLPVLKILYPENNIFDKLATKYHVISLCLKMLESVENFLKHGKTWTNIDHKTLTTSLINHIQKNFPNVQSILNDWEKSDEDLAVHDYLDTALDLLEKYKILAPHLVAPDFDFDLKKFITESEMIIEAAHLRKLQVKAVHFFIDLEPSLFKPKAELFKNVVSFSFEYYYFSKDAKGLKVLHHLLKNSGVFDGYETEIDFWIDGVLNLKNYDPSVAVFLSDLIEKVDDNEALYISQLFQFKDSNFSGLNLALNDYFSECEPSKNLKNFLSFVIINIIHVQNDLKSFANIVSKFTFLSDSLHNYMSSWISLEPTVLPKCKGKLIEHFHNFSTNFLHNFLENFDSDLYPNYRLNLLQMVIFYLTNLTKVGGLQDNHKKNCSQFLEFLISENLFEDERYIKIILANPTLIENFTVFNSDDFSTKFVLDLVKNLDKSSIENYLFNFRRKAVSSISKLFRKPEKYQNSVVSMEILEIISLNYEQCSKLLIKFTQSTDNKNFYLIACYCLNQMAELGKNYNVDPLDNNVVKELSHFFKVLIEVQISNLHSFSFSFHNYLKVFPHNIEGVETEVFDSLVSMSEFHKDNLSLCEFLLDRKPECRNSFEKNLDEICSKRSFILALLDVAIEKFSTDDVILEKIFSKFQAHIVKAIQKPHKAGQHFQNRYKSVGVLIEKFMKPDAFGTQVQKFETTEMFHVYFLKKIYDKVEKNEKKFANMTMTFIHLLVNLLKQKSGTKNVENLNEIGQIFFEFLKENHNLDVTFLSSNETLKTFCKLCLKYGVSGDFILIKILTELTQLCISEEDAKLILEMLFSHSQFLDVMLGVSQKTEVLNLWRTICTKWPQFMERNHIPILLSAYKATNSEKNTLSLLKMYESRHTQTKFSDFKPFLWGRAAASHYSVRSNFKALWRQPKMADVLNNLHFGTIVATINDPIDANSYDLDYFLPLFSHLLAPENPVTTYKFTKSGALALSLTGLRGDQTQRLATCHILQRFYFHLEARQVGKDNLLWLRFVEAICKGVSVFEDFKINNFVGVFLARTALVMTQPTDVMYVPLTQYLAAKETLDFSMVPELYTFLHSPHVNSKQHKLFILEVLRDGLKGDDDFRTLMKSMAFKLISELCSSKVCDLQTKLSVLEVFEACLRINLGVKVLCELSFLPQIFSLVLQNGHEGVVLVKLLQILSKIIEVDTNQHRNFIIYLNLVTVLENEHYFRCVTDSKGSTIFYKVFMVIVNRFPDFFDKDHIHKLLEKSNDKFCAYLVKFGCRFVKETDCAAEPELQFLRMLFYQKLKVR